MIEKLRQVKNFSELRAGSLVVVKGCTWCGSNHRGMLTDLDTRKGTWADGSVSTLPGWNMLPIPGCASRQGALGFQLTARAVAEGRLFLVETGVYESEAESYEARRLDPITQP